jgi:hypothetical protein
VREQATWQSVTVVLFSQEVGLFVPVGSLLPSPPQPGPMQLLPPGQKSPMQPQIPIQSMPAPQFSKHRPPQPISPGKQSGPGGPTLT